MGRISPSWKISSNSKKKTLKPYAMLFAGLEDQRSQKPCHGDAGFGYGRGVLKHMTYQIRHPVRVSRPVVWTDITLVSIRNLSAQAEMEASHKDPITLQVMDLKNWPKNFEAINKYLRGL